MQQDALHPPYLSLKVIYVDDDLIEIEAHAIQGGWSGTVCAYTSLQMLNEEARCLRNWSEHPEGTCALEAGSDNGSGWLRLRFYCMDLAGHTCCHIEMTRRTQTFPPPRKEEEWHLSLEMRTEPGLIERFANEVDGLAPTVGEWAVLAGVDFPEAGHSTKG